MSWRPSLLDPAGDPTPAPDGCQVIYRSSLERQMPNSAAVFQKLFKTIELCEPMFQSVVVVYRNKVRIVCVIAVICEPARFQSRCSINHDTVLPEQH